MRAIADCLPSAVGPSRPGGYPSAAGPFFVLLRLRSQTGDEYSGVRFQTLGKSVPGFDHLGVNKAKNSSLSTQARLTAWSIAS